MSSSDWAPLLMLLAGAHVCAAEVACPATANISEKVEAPGGWVAQAASRPARLHRASIFNVKPGSPEYELAPSTSTRAAAGRVTQTWELAPYRTMTIMLRCHYRGTESTLTAEIPPPIQACVYRFQLDAKGNFLGTSTITCK